MTILLTLRGLRPRSFALLPALLTLAACSSSAASDPTNCTTPLPDAGDAATTDTASAEAGSDSGATDANDAGALDPAHGVSSLAIAAGKAGAMVAYTLRCEGCGNPWLGLTEQSRALFVGLAATDPGKVTTLLDPAELKDPKKPTRIVAASSLGDDFHVVLENQDQSLTLLGGAIPGGAVISSARISTNMTVAKQTQNSTFGEKVNQGLAVTVGSDDAWLTAYDVSNLNLLSAVHVRAGMVVDTKANDTAQTASLFFAPGLKGPAGAYSTALPGSDGDLRVTFGGGTTQPAPVQGVPVAVWTDGVGGRVAIQQANGSLYVWDGKTLVRGPRADEGSCSAVTFDAKGNAMVAQAGPRTMVLFVQKDTDLLTPAVIEPSVGPIDEARAKKHIGASHWSNRSCGVATSGNVVYVAWTDVAADAVGNEVGMPIVVNVLAHDFSSISNVLKTKHDTAKNSVGNIR
jgi:hypothetical protein